MQPRILVVDDDAATRKMINTALGQSGFDILEAGTAAEAVEAIRREDPDVVLLDLILPDGDGVQVCREVRQYSDVSIIMVTAKRDLTDRLAGLDAGADDYVTKPLSMGELVARGEALSSDQSADMIWSEGEGDPMVLQTHIANLRHKLEHDPHDPKYILSADGGYRIA